MKKGGAGRGNWGKPTDAEEEGKEVKDETTLEGEAKKEEAEEKKEEVAEYKKEEVEEEEEVKGISLDEYWASKKKAT